MVSLRQKARTYVERLLDGSGVIPVGMMRRRHMNLVLAYHNIVPDDDPSGGDASLHLSLGAFENQIETLSEWVDVVPLTEILQRRPAASRPRVAITFDDGYRGAVLFGLPLLARRAMPATMFLCSGIRDDQAYWWDSFQLNAWSQQRVFFEDLQGRDEAIRSWAKERGHEASKLSVYRRVASRAEIEKAVELPGMTFGSHTVSHPNLTALPTDMLEVELRSSHNWLKEQDRLNTIPWIAYPYGLESAAVRRAARSAGYQGGLLVRGGWFGAVPDDAFGIPRFNVPAGVSQRGFRLRLAGIVGT